MLKALLLRMGSLGLVARFTIVGAVVGALLAGGLAYLIEGALTDFAREQLVARGIDQVQLGLHGRLAASDFEPPHTPEELANVAARLEPVLGPLYEEGSSIIRLHVFGSDGTVIYSDLAAKRGQPISPAAVPLLAGALNGSVGSKLSSLSSAENADLKARYGSALEVYVPFEIDGRVVGAYEICQDLAPLHPIRPLVWGAVGSGFVVLFLALLLVVRQAARQIRRQNEELAELEVHRQMDRLKSEFVSIASHELRTPLSSVLGFSGLLLEELENEEHRAWTQAIYTAAEHLSHLVAELLDVARLEQGRLKLDRQPLEIQAVVGQALAGFAINARTHRIEQRYQGPLPPVQADAGKLAQILVNLVSNAVKYSPSGGPVTVAAEPVEGMVRLSVIDQGLGIPSEELPRLFGQFHRAELPDRQGISGSGLGLYITKQLVELHGGRIWAESPGLGHGSAFHVELPAAA